MKAFHLIVLLLPQLLLAQRSEYTYVFRITAEEAETLYQYSGENLYSEPYLDQIVDSFQRKVPTLPSGHYLLVKAENEALAIQQHSVHHHGVQQIEDGNHLTLEVLDTNGQAISSGILRFDNTLIPWQEDLQRYRTKRPRDNGWLRMELPGDTLFYQVSYNKIKPQRRRFFRTPLGYVISSPYRWTKNTYHFLRRGIGRGNWYLNWRRIWPFPRKNRKLKGYLALSQPRYRPGDTLRVKTYLTKQNGKPWRAPLQLTLFGYRSQVIVQRELQPDRPGAFTTEIILADSLRLDQNYTLQFAVPGKSKYGSIAKSFRLEDYQLDAATFALNLAESSYQAGEPIVMELSAKDQNGNPLPGATVELLALRTHVSAIGADSLLIPDTLWSHQEDLSLREDNQVRLPDSIFLPADINVQLQAFFATAGGESEQQTAAFRYQYQQGKFKHSLEKGEWTFLYLEKDSSIAATATLETQRTIPPFSETSTVSLPHQLALDPFAHHYTLKNEPGLKYTFRVAVEEDGVQLLGQHTGDSLLLNIANPHHLAISYQLYEGQHLLLEGKTAENLLLEKPAQPNKKYQLNCQYIWGGFSKNKSQAFQSFARKLQLTTDLPVQIIPGQTVQVKVTATDQRERPAQGVEMVAGAVNGQFKSLSNLSPPTYTYKKKKGPKLRHQFSIEKSSNHHRVGLNAHWYQRMSLDTMLYYRIRFPEQGFFVQMDTLQEDSFYLNNPQLSPFVVEDHQLQPIYLVYLNRELVYSHYSQHEGPYAFNARPGYNQLRLRTRTAEYRMDSVYVAAGHKLTLAVDANRFGLHPRYGQQTKRSLAPPYLSAGEKDLLNLKMIRIRKEERRAVSYLYSDSTQIYRWNNRYANNTPTVIGPVPGNQQLTYLQRDSWQNTFRYEPGYIYEIREGRERLYATPYLVHHQKYELPKTLPYPALDALALTPADIIRETPRQKRINYRTSWNYVPEGGGLQFFYDTDSTLAAVIAQNVNGQYGVFRPNSRNSLRLPQGYYELTLLTQAGFTTRKKCWIYNHHLQVLDLRNNAFVQDTTLKVLEDLFTYDLIKPSFLSYDSPASSQLVNNPYEGTGYLASGTITDENGEALIGASVLLMGTNIGTVTDLDGRWSLWVPNADAVLQFSYTGFSTTQTKAGDATGDNTLAGDTAQLEEVVVIGYAVPLVEQDNTTQGGTLTAQQIGGLPTRTVEALAGRTAGLRTSDDAANINLRGSRDLATEYYVDGVRVSAATAGAELLLSGSGLRSEFRDYGFWATDLITDKQGEAFFTVTFPDDITQWQTFVLGMDDRQRAGAWYGQSAAFKPVLAQLFLPRFLLPGDQIDLIGSSVNYTNDTFQVRTQFTVEGEVLLQEEHQLTGGIADAVNYTVLSDRDSLTAKYTLQTGNYQDGEERSIPLFKVGTEETLGDFHRLAGDTTIELRFRPEDGPVTLYAQADLLSVMLEEIEALMDYPYGCNEQSASRLLALLMYKDIQEILGKTFDGEQRIQKMIALLRQRQLPNGAWGWWGGSARNQWMTIYVLRALHAAKEAGYATEAYEKGLIFLTNQLSSLEDDSRLEAIALFSEIGQNMDYATLLAPYDTLPGLNWITLTTTLIQAQQGLPYQLDTLAKYRQETLFGGHYWGQAGYGFYQNHYQYSLLAYRIYQAAGQKVALEPIQQFFLEQRHQSPAYHRRGGYRNTFEAALILKTVLPDLKLNYQDNKDLVFQQRITIHTGETILWDTLPQQVTFAASGPIKIRKTGAGQTYLTAYQRRWNPQPARVEGPFVVTSSLWQGNQKTEHLEQSRAAYLKVDLTVEKATDYILLEVPVPAGCSYGNKQRNRRYSETYREYFRDKVAIFCEHLEPGDYTYYVELEPRFTGQFQLNPAKAEQMYFPVFYGREALKTIKID